MKGEDVVTALSAAFNSLGLKVLSVKEAQPAKPPQVQNLRIRLALEIVTSSQASPTLWFELHLGDYGEKVQAFLRSSNEIEHGWGTYHSAENDAEAIQQVIHKVFKKFVEPIQLQSSISLLALKRLEFTPMPSSLTVNLNTSLGNRLEILERSTGRHVGSYLFVKYELFRSFQDEIFDHSLMVFEPLTTHFFSELEKLHISPDDWASLLQAWIARDVFYNFPHLEPNDIAFAQFGKEVRLLPRRIPSKLRNNPGSGLANWVTRRDVSLRTKSREKWYPESWPKNLIVDTES